MWKLFNFFANLLGHQTAEGNIYLVLDGRKEISIDTGFTPKEVWIRPMEPTGTPVCMGDTDSFDVQIVPNGFVLIVDLSNETREVQWISIG